MARRRRFLVEFFFVEHLLELFVAVFFVELVYFVHYHYGAGPPGGVPELPVERIDLLLECLEDHQAADHGPEARWALARLVRRLEDAQASLQVVLEVLARRLRPRGYLPVTRVPHARAEQVRLLTWMINSAAFVTETLEFHLRTPLQPDETTLAAGPRASPPAAPVGRLDDEQAVSSEDGEAAASSSSPHGIVMSSNASCRSRSRSPPPRPPDDTLGYTMGADAFGLDICLLPAEREDEDMEVSLSSVPEGIQRALDGELLVCIHNIDYDDFCLNVYVDLLDCAVYYPVDTVSQYDDNLYVDFADNAVYYPVDTVFQHDDYLELDNPACMQFGAILMYAGDYFRHCLLDFTLASFRLTGPMG
ncbi:hypothetical protein AK812_SmicGene16083 [Symbiodinium microadriaticum]|uniref:Uncharacterized protein n=1 Tax=Symbiodinium microadriaticum TaxID=2951 RepID=A0A1Q9E1A3_SYMMI|nr:hypothetical protein AK812_SmicGene16083 [Symbiodinium microadriaticum]CAE7654624.1 unnamed protein product [Symbiodinium microadriaticum]CAE7717583.1 unnamed protein product [Symbiodinium sp. KB8]